MFNWLKTLVNKPSAQDHKQEDLSRFVSEGGPDPVEARNSDKREVIAIKAHRAQKQRAKKHVAKKAVQRKHAA